jgi:hypothetical protein
MQFVEIDESGLSRTAGYAPYLDYRPATHEEVGAVSKLLDQDWLKTDLESNALSYGVTNLVPSHFREIKERKEARIDKTTAAVKERLTKEINYWDFRAEELKVQELAGKTPRLNSARARQRADELQARLQKRLQELEQERQLSAQPPVVIGGALVVPSGLLASLMGSAAQVPAQFARETERISELAMSTVMEIERRLGFDPRDVSSDKVGYDVESRIPGTGRLRFIEVKGRIAGAQTVTVTKNEVLTALNKPDEFILGLVQVGVDAVATRYLMSPFVREPDFHVTSVNYDFDELWQRAEVPL